jgi:hypothetical protein
VKQRGNDQVRFISVCGLGYERSYFEQVVDVGFLCRTFLPRQYMPAQRPSRPRRCQLPRRSQSYANVANRDRPIGRHRCKVASSGALTLFTEAERAALSIVALAVRQRGRFKQWLRMLVGAALQDRFDCWRLLAASKEANGRGSLAA